MSSPPSPPHASIPQPATDSPAPSAPPQGPPAPTARASGSPLPADDSAASLVSLATRASTRIANKRHPSADALADIRRQKKRLVLRQGEGSAPPAPTPSAAKTTRPATSGTPSPATAATASPATAATGSPVTAAPASSATATAASDTQAGPRTTPGRVTAATTNAPAATSASSTSSPATPSAPASAGADTLDAPQAPKKPAKKPRAKVGSTPKRATKKKSTPSATSSACSASAPLAPSTSAAAPPALAPPIEPPLRSTSAQAAPPVILSVDSDSDSDADFDAAPPTQGYPAPLPHIDPDVADPTLATSPLPGGAQPVSTRPLPRVMPTSSGVAPPAHRARADRAPFDLTEFLSRFHTGPQAAPASAPHTSLSPAETVTDTHVHRHLADRFVQDSPGAGPDLAGVLTELLDFVRGHPARAVGGQIATPTSAPATTPQPWPTPDPLFWTLPNAKGILPPVETRNLRTAQFQPPAHRVRGDFTPTATHDLAAHRLIPFLTSPEGMHETPMGYVLRIREEFPFDNAPAIAIAARRFGRHGLTIMHCKRVDRATRLRAGSADANFNMDFGRSASPPPAPGYTSYFDLLSAVQGLTTFANANWHEPMAHVMYRVREFVSCRETRFYESLSLLLSKGNEPYQQHTLSR
ncbi:hypothetical protein PF002_g26472 [Phytophthora fragariae]|uniref:Uncharacterized protein n=1 Tax=Phytophthora fragariae TaxID=53985 RepID=A0A6A4BNV4_9STRA|nr:hypothetical protein PF002_g26472 [Phytophthora fragariae]KAE9277944.1 hypothetical protein PF001_g25406 [Phytophthora fragariae]